MQTQKKIAILVILEESFTGSAAIPLLIFIWLAFESCPFVMAQDSAQAAQTQGAPPPAEQSEPAENASDEAPYAKLSKEQLERLVAPIALYPDALVAQILAASSFPTQITDAETWLQTHPGLSIDIWVSRSISRTGTRA
jgi:hypothetical protein